MKSDEVELVFKAENAARLSKKWKARGESQTGKRLSSEKPTGSTIRPAVAQVILELENALQDVSGGSVLEPKPDPPDGFCWIWALLGSLGYLEDSSRDTLVPSTLDWARGMFVIEETARNTAKEMGSDSDANRAVQVSPFLLPLHPRI